MIKRTNSKRKKSAYLKTVFYSLKEFELTYNLGPKPTKAQILKIKLYFSQIVKDNHKPAIN